MLLLLSPLGSIETDSKFEGWSMPDSARLEEVTVTSWVTWIEWAEGVRECKGRFGGAIVLSEELLLEIPIGWCETKGRVV